MPHRSVDGEREASSRSEVDLRNRGGNFWRRSARRLSSSLVAARDKQKQHKPCPPARSRFQHERLSAGFIYNSRNQLCAIDFTQWHSSLESLEPTTPSIVMAEHRGRSCAPVERRIRQSQKKRDGSASGLFRRGKSSASSDKTADSDDGSARGSQQSLMSLMSSIAGTSAFGSPKIGKRIVGQPVNMRSNASSQGSSRSSYCDYVIAPPKQQHGLTNGRRSYPYGQPSPRNGVTSRLSAVSTLTNNSTTPRDVLPLPDGLFVRPMFPQMDVASAHELDAAFLGREWLFRECHDALLQPQAEGGTRVLVLHGAAGTGKTAITRQLAAHSPFFLPGDDARGSADSGYINGSRDRIDMHNGTPPPEWLRTVASRVAAVHFCRIEQATSCAVGEFVINLAAQLAVSPLFRSYAEHLASNNDLQKLLKSPDCTRVEPAVVFQRVIVDPLSQIKPTDGQPLLIVLDAVDEAEFHRPESTDSLAAFVRRHCTQLPTWCRWLVTVRSEQLALLEPLPASRRISLDDAPLLDERLYRDAQLYVQSRLHWSPQIQDVVAQISGLSDSDDPLMHFTEHMVATARGNMLYLRLTLDLIEQGHLKLRTSSYSALPVNLGEVFLLLFNLRYPTITAFERVSSILSVMLATLRPLTADQIRHTVNAGSTAPGMTGAEFVHRLSQLGDFVTHRSDDTLTPFHPAFRDWLLRRADGTSPKFLVDIRAREFYLRQGHMLLALRASRRGELNADELIELGHHLLKAHPYKHLRIAPSEVQPSADQAAKSQNHPTVEGGASGRDCQLMCIQQAAADLRTALCSDKNILSPNTKVTRLLLMAGADANAGLSDGEPLLCRAAAVGRGDLCALLLEFDAAVDDVRHPDQQMTPLMLAARNGHLDVVQILHQHGAKLTAVDAHHRTALVHAAVANAVPVLSFLLQCDWTMSRDVDDEPRASTSAASPPATPVLNDASHKARAMQQAFVAAAGAGQLRVCQFLCDMCDVSADSVCPITRRTALSAAAGAGHGDVVRYLLQCGASVRKVQGADSTPLLTAVAGGSWEVVSLLLARGLDVENEQDQLGRTPLMAAAQHGHIGVMELLLSRGADVDASKLDGRGALHDACEHNQPACAALLIDRGCKLTLADKRKQTPLHVAAKYASKRLVQLLLDRGAQLEAVDAFDHRPIDVAVANGNLGALSCFLRRGAKLSSATWELARCNPEIAFVLLQKLIDDGSILYRRNRLKDAAHRFEYAQRKLANVQLQEQTSCEQRRTRLCQLTYHIGVGLGRCRRRMGEFADAIECCDDALRLSVPSGGFEAHLLRAKCHFDMQDVRAATADAENAVRLCPQSSEAKQLLASLKIPPQESAISNGNVDSTDGDAALRVCTQTNKSRQRSSPADCSSDSGNQADFEDPHALSPSNRSCETEL